jgi:hypothetical protein
MINSRPFYLLWSGDADEFSNPYQGLLLNSGEYEVRVVPTQAGTLHSKARITEDTTTTVWTKDAVK